MIEGLEAAARKWSRGCALSVALDEGRIAPALKPRIDRMMESGIEEMYVALGYDPQNDEDMKRLVEEAVEALKAELGR